MAKAELTSIEFNKAQWVKIKKLQAQIADLKAELKPAELPPQAGLNACNQMARKVKTKPVAVNPKLL